MIKKMQNTRAKKLIEIYQSLGLNVNILRNLNRNVLSGIQNKKMKDCIDTEGNSTLKYLGAIFTKSGKYK
jgi:hypothetical protein